jgi:hypothetical protein
MAGRVVRKAGGAGPRGVDVNYDDIADGSPDVVDQVIDAENSASRGMVDDARASQVVNMLRDNPTFASAFPGFIRTVVETGAPHEMDLLRSVLQKVEAETPGRSMEILNQAGSPEALMNEFAGGEEVAPPKWVRDGDSIPRYRRPNTFGQGLGKATDMEIRSKASRIEGVGQGSPASMQNMARYILSPSSYRRGRDAQADQLRETLLTPEIIQTLTPQQRAILVGAQADQITPEILQQFYGVKPSEDLVKSMPMAQRDSIVGPASFGEANFATDAGGMSDGFEEGRRMMSTRDQVLQKMINAAETGGTIPMGAHFKYFRYPFPESQGGAIVRPDNAPSGQFMAGLAQTGMKLPNFENFQGMMAPMFERSIREQAQLPPATTNFRGLPGKTEQDYARLMLTPERDGFYLRQLEGNMPYPQFMDDVTINRGPKEPLNLGGLLLDRPAVDAVEPPISTPDGEMPVDAGEQQVLPADDELGMYDPRRMNPSVLAALMA